MYAMKINTPIIVKAKSNVELLKIRIFINPPISMPSNAIKAIVPSFVKSLFVVYP